MRSFPDINLLEFCIFSHDLFDALACFAWQGRHCDKDGDLKIMSWVDSLWPWTSKLLFTAYNRGEVKRRRSRPQAHQCLF